MLTVSLYGWPTASEGLCSSYLQVSMKMAEGGADYDALMKKMDKLQTAIDAIEGWELDRQLERAMQALRCPPGTLCRRNTTRLCCIHVSTVINLLA